jgi:phage antirepressor YoqD-like protein
MNLPARVYDVHEKALSVIQELQDVNLQLAAQLETKDARIDTLEAEAKEHARIWESADTLNMAMAAARVSEALGVSIGRDRLCALCREMGLIYKQSAKSGYRTYQRSIDAGYFKNCTTSKNGELYSSVQVTPKGVQWLIHRIDEYLAKNAEPAALIAQEGQYDA